MDFRHGWRIEEVNAKGLPPWAVGYNKIDGDGNVFFCAVAYCFAPAQAVFVLNSFDAQASPEDWVTWEAGYVEPIESADLNLYPYLFHPVY